MDCFLKLRKQRVSSDVLLPFPPQAPLVEQHLPAVFLVEELPDNREHAGAGDLPGLPQAAVLQDPHHLAGCPQLVELRIGEVSGLDREHLCGAAITLAFRP